ncbi:D-3-phosphoglycerate dehydrogenase [Centipeda periodontii DSM 2778]|jgi:phosphoglycerate dehydrogenase family protein|uniref:D-3-phosphoglycerate dehydrogenase n=2 Tax=Centipeda TaxID=82202 RepID=F5RKT7_9FIRM|nr:D-3-phosphoglycerate dehydrogenase [Centipeda periodontii DSM 2778]
MGVPAAISAGDSSEILGVLIMEKTKILCVADGGITVQMMEELRALEKFGAEITIVEDKDMYAMGPITDRMTLIEHKGIDAAPTCEALLENCADKDILVVHVASINKEVIEKAKHLKVAAVLRGGYENADVPLLTEKGVKLINAPWRSANAVADFTVGMMIAENKNIARSHHLLMEGKWCKKYDNQSYIHDMRKMTVGIIGYGYIGQRVRMRLQGFECKVLVHDPYADPKQFADHNVEFVALDELLRQSDMVTLHLRLSEKTEHFIGKDELSKMKSTAYLINTARAGLVDTAALADALRDHVIGGAAIDVYDVEPLPADHPYLRLSNITLTSHLAGTSCDTMMTSVEIGLEDLKRYLTGEEMVNIRN